MQKTGEEGYCNGKNRVLYGLSLRDPISPFPQTREFGWGRRCVFMRSPQLERRNPQPLGPQPQNPRPAKSHGPLKAGRPGPQVAEGAPPSSTTGSTPAQPKLVCLALMGSARLERRGGDRGSERCPWRGCPEETRESSIWDGRARLVTRGHSSRGPPNPAAVLRFPSTQ